MLCDLPRYHANFIVSHPNKMPPDFPAAIYIASFITVRLRFLVWSAVWPWPMCLLVVVRASGWCRHRTACLVRPRWISRFAGYIFSRRWSVLQLTWFAPSMASIASRTPHSGHISVWLSSRDSAGCPVYVCLHFGQILGSSMFSFRLIVSVTMVLRKACYVNDIYVVVVSFPQDIYA